jgi:hypothetical protein
MWINVDPWGVVDVCWFVVSWGDDDVISAARDPIEPPIKHLKTLKNPIKPPKNAKKNPIKTPKIPLKPPKIAAKSHKTP